MIHRPTVTTRAQQVLVSFFVRRCPVNLKQKFRGMCGILLPLIPGLIGFGVLNWLKPNSLAILHNMTTFRILTISYLKGNVRLESEAVEK